MKKLIVYDASCPMCQVYTRGMVATDGSGNLTRISNHDLTDRNLLSRIDPQRARHEIPLVDLNGGETLYGIDTWSFVFGATNRTVAQLLSLRWVRAFFEKLYAFISFNRRIIITAAPDRWQLLDLTPEFRLNYRLAFVGLVFALTGLVHYGVAGQGWLLPALLAGQVGLVALYVGVTKRYELTETLLDYCGHLGMSLLLGSLIVAASVLLHWPTGILVGSVLTIGQHFIRTYRLGLNPWLSVSFAMLYLLAA